LAVICDRRSAVRIAFNSSGLVLPGEGAFGTEGRRNISVSTLLASIFLLWEAVILARA
jgi:hypothetical protein